MNECEKVMKSSPALFSHFLLVSFLWKVFFSLFWMFIWKATTPTTMLYFLSTFLIHDDVTWWWYSLCRAWMGDELVGGENYTWNGWQESRLPSQQWIWARKVAACGWSEWESENVIKHQLNFISSGDITKWYIISSLISENLIMALSSSSYHLIFNKFMWYLIALFQFIYRAYLQFSLQNLP